MGALATAWTFRRCWSRVEGVERNLTNVHPPFQPRPCLFFQGRLSHVPSLLTCACIPMIRCLVGCRLVLHTTLATCCSGIVPTQTERRKEGVKGVTACRHPRSSLWVPEGGRSVRRVYLLEGSRCVCSSGWWARPSRPRLCDVMETTMAATSWTRCANGIRNVPSSLGRRNKERRRGMDARLHALRCCVGGSSEDEEAKDHQPTKSRVNKKPRERGLTMSTWDHDVGNKHDETM